MPPATDLQATFDALRAVLAKYAAHFPIKADTPGHYYLDTKSYGQSGSPIGFGAVILRKDKVTLYLMCVYCRPELLESASPALKKAEAGKSCFHFKSVDAALIEELTRIVAGGFEWYRDNGLLEAIRFVPPRTDKPSPAKKTAAKTATKKPAAKKPAR